MAALEITMFGRLQVRCDQQPLTGFETLKVQELLGYILLNRARPHPRETLAELLWNEQTDLHAKKYLRKVLWQLQAALTPLTQVTGVPLVHVEDEWIEYNAGASCRLDIAEFEASFAQVEGLAGETLTKPLVDAAERAIPLYMGDLLETWYHDWSLQARERYRYMYLVMLEKLMRYYEAHDEFDVAIGHGIRLLCHEPAHEWAHRRLMRIYLRTGNRAAAVRQYEFCVTALDRELEVPPSPRTQRLYAQIRLGELEPRQLPVDGATLNDLYQRLKQVESTLAATHRAVAQDVQTLELLIRRQR